MFNGMRSVAIINLINKRRGEQSSDTVADLEFSVALDAAGHHLTVRDGSTALMKAAEHFDFQMLLRLFSSETLRHKNHPELDRPAPEEPALSEVKSEPLRFTALTFAISKKDEGEYKHEEGYRETTKQRNCIKLLVNKKSPIRNDDIIVAIRRGNKWFLDYYFQHVHNNKKDTLSIFNGTAQWGHAFLIAIQYEQSKTLKFLLDKAAELKVAIAIPETAVDVIRRLAKNPAYALLNMVFPHMTRLSELRCVADEKFIGYAAQDKDFLLLLLSGSNLAGAACEKKFKFLSQVAIQVANQFIAEVTSENRIRLRKQAEAILACMREQNKAHYESSKEQPVMQHCIEFADAVVKQDTENGVTHFHEITDQELANKVSRKVKDYLDDINQPQPEELKDDRTPLVRSKQMFKPADPQGEIQAQLKAVTAQLDDIRNKIAGNSVLSRAFDELLESKKMIASNSSKTLSPVD